MEIKELLLGWVTFLASLVLVIAFVAGGWYLVWWLFLSRFRFVRELLGNNQEGGAVTNEVRQPRPRAVRRVRRE